MGGMLKAIYIAENEGATMTARESVELVAGKGIVGDRYYRADGADAEEQITLVDEDQLDNFNAEHGRSVSGRDTRRNIATRGIDLNALVGSEFRIGSLRLRGIELCEPCATLGAALATDSMSAAAAVRALVGRGGLRACILDSGTVRRGDTIEAGTASPSADP